jgi:hypothetical protein
LDSRNRGCQVYVRLRFSSYFVSIRVYSWLLSASIHRFAGAVQVFIFERGAREPRWLSGLVEQEKRRGLIKDCWAGLQRNHSSILAHSSFVTRSLSYSVRRRNPSSPRSRTLRYIGDAGFDVSDNTNVPKHRSQAAALDALILGCPGSVWT